MSASWLKILFVDSQDFPGMGWITEQAKYETFRHVLENLGVAVEFAEVKTASELDDLVRQDQGGPTLVWPNAYLVWDGEKSGQTRYLAEVLDMAGASYVGSPSSALVTMLDKSVCQARLADAGIPIPRCTLVAGAAPKDLTAALVEAGLAFPVVVKPPSTAGSRGISVASDLGELTKKVAGVLEEYGDQVLIEEYLPGCDLTVAVFPNGEETFLLPTWYEVDEQVSGPSILDLPKRLKPWGADKRMRCVTDPVLLEQIEEILPRAAKVLGIQDVTRADGRLDEQGVLRLFDVNGMPGLEYPESLIVQQVMAAWAGMEGPEALERLICTLVVSAAARSGLEIPASVAARTLCHSAPGSSPAAFRRVRPQEILVPSRSSLPRASSSPELEPLVSATRG